MLNKKISEQKGFSIALNSIPYLCIFKDNNKDIPSGIIEIKNSSKYSIDDAENQVFL